MIENFLYRKTEKKELPQRIFRAALHLQINYEVNDYTGMTAYAPKRISQPSNSSEIVIVL